MGNIEKHRNILKDIPNQVSLIGDDLRDVFAKTIEEDAWPLYLYGPACAGKTCAALTLADIGEWARYYLLCNLVGERLESREGRLMSMEIPCRLVRESDWLKTIVELDLLIIDEIGRSDSPATIEYETLRDVITLRENKPLIAISNLSPQELLSLYGDSIVSRLLSGTVHSCTSKIVASVSASNRNKRDSHDSQ